MKNLVCKQETTVWPSSTPNHTYIFTGSNTKAVGYVRNGEVIKFNVPMTIDDRGRKFKQVPVTPGIAEMFRE